MAGKKISEVNKRKEDNLKAKNRNFKKRKESILKKSKELSVLCDIKVCVIIVDSDGKLITWPENKNDLTEILKLYKGYDDHFKDNVRNSKRAVESDNFKDGKSSVPDVLGLKNLVKESDDQHVHNWIEGSSASVNDDQMDGYSMAATAVIISDDPINLMEETAADDDRKNDQIMSSCNDDGDHEQDFEGWINSLLDWKSFEKDVLFNP